MHSSLVRLQNVFGYFTTVAFAVASIIAISVLLHPQSPSAKLQMSNISVVKGRPHYYSSKKEEYAHIKFNLNADLTSLFSWNTKQLFVYVVAVLPPNPNDLSAPPSEAVIWDAIIPSPLAPWHPNTYIDPSSTKSPKQSRDRAAMRAATPPDKQSKKLRAHDAALDAWTPYPKGATEGILTLRDQKPKYQITTPAGRIAGLESCTLHLRYNVQPWVGALTWDVWPRRSVTGKEAERWFAPLWKAVKGGRSDVFEMPALKGSTGASELGTEAGGEANRGKPA